MELFIFLGVLILVFSLILIGMYNGLIERATFVENATAGVDVQLKKRFDLIPNLVEVAKQYMLHERALFEKIAEMRAKALLAKDNIEGAAAIDKETSACLKQLLISVENYPVLKSNENFLNVQQSLLEVEEQLSAARRAFNSAVTEYNNAVLMVPTNIMAGLMGYKKKPLFSISEQEKQSVKISFN